MERWEKAYFLDETEGPDDEWGAEGPELTVDEIVDGIVGDFYSSSGNQAWSLVEPNDEHVRRLRSSSGIIYQSGLVDAADIIHTELHVGPESGNEAKIIPDAALYERHAEIVKLAEGMFPSQRDAMIWLEWRHRGLGMTPLEAMKTMEGCDEVEKQIKLLYPCTSI